VSAKGTIGYSEGMTQDWIDHWHLVNRRIRQAEIDADRPEHAVRLLAVSKTFPAQAVQELALTTSQRDFGENYVQEGVDKILTLSALSIQPQLVWHCIGPIQSNKTRMVAEHFDWVHSIDRLRIAQRLNEQRPEHLPPLQVCLQVNIDGGENKSGVAPEQALDLAREITQLPRLQLRGLMTIPEPVEGFAAQCALHRQAQAMFATLGQALELAHWDTLSMGMSTDLEAAVHCGSTLVRIGTAIFGQRPRAGDAFPVQFQT
jgi:pyridoxal phosphate enzyme (YggS family)